MTQIMNNLNEKNILPITVSILFFLTMLIFSLSAKDKSYTFIKKQYERINNTLRTKKGALFDYNDTKNFLTKNGAAFHIKIFKNPTVYLIIRFLIAFLGFFVGSLIRVELGIIIAVLSFILIKAYLIQCNKRDNKEMASDIQILYNSLHVRIKAGIYPADALCEIAESLKSKRLYYALNEFKGDLLVHVGFKEAIKRLNSKFNNKYISSLTLTLSQAADTGCALELLNDLADQISTMRNAELISKKENLDRLISMCELALLLVGAVFILAVSISQMAVMANGFN